MEDDVECTSCSWSGHHSELVCSDEDSGSDRPESLIHFNLCPDCGSDEIEDMDEEEAP